MRAGIMEQYRDMGIIENESRTVSGRLESIQQNHGNNRIIEQYRERYNHWVSGHVGLVHNGIDKLFCNQVATKRFNNWSILVGTVDEDDDGSILLTGLMPLCHCTFQNGM
jgi:hypothetical protein